MDYGLLASKETVERTVTALREKKYEVFTVETKEEALEKIKQLIPPGASVMNGSSQTLETIGFTEYLKSKQHGWNNLHDAILKEKDTARQSALRKQAVLSDFYLGSVHALTEVGEMIIASNTGSQLPHLVFTSRNLILVIGSQKIVPDLQAALKRVEEYVYPLENKRINDLYKTDTVISKELIFRSESPFSTRKIFIVIVNEVLGF